MILIFKILRLGLIMNEIFILRSALQWEKNHMCYHVYLSEQKWYQYGSRWYRVYLNITKMIKIIINIIQIALRWYQVGLPRLYQEIYVHLMLFIYNITHGGFFLTIRPILNLISFIIKPVLIIKDTNFKFAPIIFHFVLPIFMASSL